MMSGQSVPPSFGLLMFTDIDRCVCAPGAVQQQEWRLQLVLGHHAKLMFLQVLSTQSKCCLA
jgi:hypothetical protein